MNIKPDDPDPRTPNPGSKPPLYPANPVLMVDDEEPIVSGYRRALTRAGINNLICHTDSRAALNDCMTKALSFVIVDLNMPFVNGEQVLEAAVKHQPGVPVVVVTGRDTTEIVVKCVKMGAYDYLVKPISADRIVTTVRNALQRSELLETVKRMKERFSSMRAEIEMWRHKQ